MASLSVKRSILQLTKEIYESFDKNQFNLGVLTKLTSFGIQGSYIDWFNSYLSNRQQYIPYEDKKSKIKTITCGVPQDLF